MTAFLPTKKLEATLLSEGFAIIAGIDEAGRGSWAGPVVAGALIYDEKKAKKIKGIADSKIITPKERDYFYNRLIESFDWGVGIIDHQEIDLIGILPATKKAMAEAVKDLKAPPDFLVIDAVKLLKEINLPQKSLIKGDRLVWSIAAASIIAKVYRDQLMIELHEKYPSYGFNNHKGYGTREHQNALNRCGICEIHRKTYKPVAKMMTGD